MLTLLQPASPMPSPATKALRRTNSRPGDREHHGDGLVGRVPATTAQMEQRVAHAHERGAGLALPVPVRHQDDQAAGDDEGDDGEDLQPEDDVVHVSRPSLLASRCSQEMIGP